MQFWGWLVIAFGIAGLSSSLRAEAADLRSRWDESLLSIELGAVRINPNNFIGAWEEMGTKYLLRANLFVDEQADNNQTLFAFNKQQTTAKDLLNAYLTTYPEFTYTQDPESGVIWIYPKRTNYQDILKQKINILPGARRIPMYSGAYLPLCHLLAPSVLDEYDPSVPGFRSQLTDRAGKPIISHVLFYDVDLPAGVCSARDILNSCCVANPNTAFEISPVLGRPSTHVIYINNLLTRNPIALPRAAAIKFWKIELGKPTNGIPSVAELGTALSDLDARRRSAACLYYDSCLINYTGSDLIKQAESIDQEAWIVLGWQYVQMGAQATNGFRMMMASNPSFRENLGKIKNVDLALLVSMELTRENLDASSVDAIINRQKYSRSEISSIMPELIRMARSSEAVCDKLRAMNLPIDDLNESNLNWLENSNYLTLVPPDK